MKESAIKRANIDWKLLYLHSLILLPFAHLPIEQMSLTGC
jgi:hypothetical protein